MPENTPAETSHVEESTLMTSPPSPRVSVPVVVSVPLMLLLAMTPPESVRASVRYVSPIVVEAARIPEESVTTTPAVSAVSMVDSSTSANRVPVSWCRKW